VTTNVLLPKLGFASAEGVVTEWLVPDGSQVKEGQAIYNLESEKSVTEVESPATGKIKFLVENGTTCPVGMVIAEIE
jgi:pyruvate/2-oxoglutarate dehydrogenase complex dihydrolipoamide acyltransferase (E2) component